MSEAPTLAGRAGAALRTDQSSPAALTGQNTWRRSGRKASRAAGMMLPFRSVRSRRSPLWGHGAGFGGAAQPWKNHNRARGQCRCNDCKAILVIDTPCLEAAPGSSHWRRRQLTRGRDPGYRQGESPPSARFRSFAAFAPLIAKTAGQPRCAAMRISQSLHQPQANEADRCAGDAGERQARIGERHLGQSPVGCNHRQGGQRHADIGSPQRVHAAIQ